MTNLSPLKRPLIEVSRFNMALAEALLTNEEESIIDYIRYTGVFDELKMRKDL